MSGKIPVFLLIMICSCSFIMEVRLSLPEFDVTIINECNKMKTKATWGDVEGLAYPVLYSEGPIRCAVVYINPIYTYIDVLDALGHIGYHYTLYYFDPSDTNHTTRIISPTTTLIPNIFKRGEAQSYLINANGTFKLSVRTIEVVGYSQPNPALQGGYSLIECKKGGGQELSIVVRNIRNKSEEENALKAQLVDNNLQNIPLYEVYHGDDCRYYKP